MKEWFKQNYMEKYYLQALNYMYRLYEQNWATHKKYGQHRIPYWYDIKVTKILQKCKQIVYIYCYIEWFIKSSRPWRTSFCSGKTDTGSRPLLTGCPPTFSWLASSLTPNSYHHRWASSTSSTSGQSGCSSSMHWSFGSNHSKSARKTLKVHWSICSVEFVAEAIYHPCRRSVLYDHLHPVQLHQHHQHLLQLRTSRCLLLWSLHLPSKVKII